MGRKILIAYAAIMAFGGVWGALKGSLISIVAGGGSAVALAFIASYAQKNPQKGIQIGILLTVLLTGNFLRRFFKTHEWMPNGVFGILSVVVLLALIVALTQERGSAHV